MNANEKYDIKGDVVVIGGGNVAIDVARDSKRCASDDTKVNMFCLESRETMPASVEEIEEAELMQKEDSIRHMMRVSL